MNTGTLTYAVDVNSWELMLHGRTISLFGRGISPALSPEEILYSLSEHLAPLVELIALDDIQILVRRNDGSNVGMLSVSAGAITAVLPKNYEGAPT